MPEDPKLTDSMIIDFLGVNDNDEDKFIKLSHLLAGVLKKEADQRNATDQAVINKFIANSEVFSQIGRVMSVAAVKNMLKYAHIHEVDKGRTLYKSGADINRVVVLLEGKLGVVKDQAPQLSKVQSSTTTAEEKYEQILKTSPEIMKYQKRKKFIAEFDLSEYINFQTVEADLNELQFKEQIYKETIFNIQNVMEGKKYRNTLVTCEASKILSISSKMFYQTFTIFLKKLKAQKIRAFRKFYCFANIDDEKLLKIAENLSLIRKRKGEFVYREGQPFECIYLLFSGHIKITKTVDLFREDPNSLYLDRATLNKGKSEILPFANLSAVYNYKPRSKLVELAEISDIGIFGQEQYFTNSEREVNVQVSSQQATYYEINLQKLGSWFPENKSYVEQFTGTIYKHRTEKKILFRQQTLAQILHLENQNSMDYFYMEEGREKPEPTLKKFKINQINQTVSVRRDTDKKVYHKAPFNKFNFTKLAKKQKRNLSQGEFSQEESRIADFLHTVSGDEFRVPSTRKKNSINIKNPLFELSYFTAYQKQILKMEKQKKLKPIATSRKASARKKMEMTGRLFYEN